MAQGKRQFKNTTNGYVGVTIYTPRGEEKGTVVEPGATIFLSEDEIELTRDAPAEAKDNPFAPQPYEIRDPDTDEVVDSGVRPLLEEVPNQRDVPTAPEVNRRVSQRQDPDEVGVTSLPPSKLAAGSYQSGEEVGT